MCTQWVVLERDVGYALVRSLIFDSNSEPGWWKPVTGLLGSMVLEIRREGINGMPGVCGSSRYRIECHGRSQRGTSEWMCEVGWYHERNSRPNLGTGFFAF